MSHKTNISVIVATYNGEKYIREQIASILRQLKECDEIIVSDDWSTDSTIPIINRFADSRISVIYSVGTKGPVRNFENGIRRATRDIVVLSDQDDVWLDGRLDTIRTTFSESKSTNLLIVLDSAVVNEQLEMLHNSVFELLNSGMGLTKNILRNTYIGCHMAFSRTLVPIITPFPKNIPMHDVWIGLICELVGEVKFIQSTSMLFRRTGENFTQTKYSWGRRLTWRVNLITNILLFLKSHYKMVFLRK